MARTKGRHAARPQRRRRRWCTAFVFLAAAGGVGAGLVLLLQPAGGCTVEIPRTNPYSAKAVADLMRRRGLSPVAVRVRGTRSRSVMLRAERGDTMIVAYVRREILQDRLPQGVAKELGVHPAQTFGVVNVSLYEGHPDRVGDTAMETLRQLTHDLARDEFIPCTDE